MTDTVDMNMTLREGFEKHKEQWDLCQKYKANLRSSLPHWEKMTPNPPLKDFDKYFPAFKDAVKKHVWDRLRTVYRHLTGTIRLSLPRQPPGHWEDPGNVMKSLEKTAPEYISEGKMPPGHRIDGGCYCGILRHHGGLNGFAEKAGLTTQMLKKPSSHWKSFDNVMKSLKETAPEHISKGIMPPRNMIDSGCFQGIKKYHGGLAKFAEKAGMTTQMIKKPNGYWEDPSNVMKSLKETAPEHISKGIMPPVSMIDSGCRQGIVKYHGSPTEFAEKAGLTLSGTKYRARDGKILRSAGELVVCEYLYSREISYEIEVKPFPGTKHRSDFMLILDSVVDYVEVWGYSPHLKDKISIAYNKKRKIKEQMYKDAGLNLISTEGSKLSIYGGNFSKSKKYLDEKFAKHRINTKKSHSFTKEIILQGIIPQEEDEEKVIAAALKLIKKNGTFPTRKQLVDEGFTKHAIRKCGELRGIREKMGLSIQQEKPNKKNVRLNLAEINRRNLLRMQQI